jgi:predicted nuclease of predicted toxin-antitoxin system
MRIKTDEDLPREVSALLTAQGHDAQTVLDEGMCGWKDPALWAAVQREERFLITADKGFGNLLDHPPGTHCGVLLLRPDEDGIPAVLDLTRRVLTDYPLESLARTLAVATPRGVRVRRASVRDR